MIEYNQGVISLQTMIRRPVSKLEEGIKEIIKNRHEADELFIYTDEDSSNVSISSVKYDETDERRARITARLREGELNPNNKNRQACAREYLLSVKKRIKDRYHV